MSEERRRKFEVVARFTVEVSQIILAENEEDAEKQARNLYLDEWPTPDSEELEDILCVNEVDLTVPARSASGGKF